MAVGRKLQDLTQEIQIYNRLRLEELVLLNTVSWGT